MIDYVIAHELGHLPAHQLESKRNPGFWSTIRAKTPTMEKAEAWLRDNSHVLEREL